MKLARISLFAFVLLAAVAASRGDDPPPPKAAPTVDDFTDKVALVFLDTALRVPTWVLIDVEIKEIGGRTFLTGIGADTKRDADWRAGKKIRVSWPLVTGYILFTAEEYEQHVKEAKEDD